MNTFTAYRIHQDATGHHAGPESLALDQLTPGEVTVRVEWSAVNYKDALAVTGRGKILRKSPLVGGIDAAGRVEASTDPRFIAGMPVVVIGGGLGETRDGGYAPWLRVPADAVIPLPDGLTTRQAMIVGTAGFAAALALDRMEHNGQRPDLGPILVTGASGGVGSFATALCTRRGYAVAALTLKPESIEYLQGLGARKVILRHGLEMGRRALETARFGGVIDTLGGDYLGWALRCVAPTGNVAALGMATGGDFSTSVMPFILRGVNLLGINSAEVSRERRTRLWHRLAEDLDARQLDAICAGEVDFAGLRAFCVQMLDGHVHGRTLVRVDA
ncbi:MAG: YhdH/YhfP family quinone oxidoreductase [Gammaproteobacteria bacterium]